MAQLAHSSQSMIEDQRPGTFSAKPFSCVRPAGEPWQNPSMEISPGGAARGDGGSQNPVSFFHGLYMIHDAGIAAHICPCRCQYILRVTVSICMCTCWSAICMCAFTIDLAQIAPALFPLAYFLLWRRKHLGLQTEPRKSWKLGQRDRHVV